MPEIFEWAEPGPKASRGATAGVWLKRLAPLSERPGSWAMVYEGKTQRAASAAATNLRNGRIRDVDPSKYEITSRATRVFARMHGGDAIDNGDVPPARSRKAK